MHKQKNTAYLLNLLSSVVSLAVLFVHFPNIFSSYYISLSKERLIIETRYTVYLTLLVSPHFFIFLSFFQFLFYQICIPTSLYSTFYVTRLKNHLSFGRKNKKKKENLKKCGCDLLGEIYCIWPTNWSQSFFDGDRKGARISGRSRNIFIGPMMTPPHA